MQSEDPKVYTPPISETHGDIKIAAMSNVGSVREENQDYMGFKNLGEYI